MRRVPYPVAIITATDPSGRPDTSAFRGMTVSSFNTVTLSPRPVISFNVRRPSETLNALLASRRTFDHKVQVLFPTTKSREHAQRVFHRVRKGAERYVLLQAFKGLLLSSLFWVILRVFGMHGAVFLSFLVFLASFIPIVGPAAAVVIPVVLALAQFGFGWRPVLLFVSLQAIVVAIDSVLLPRLQGDRLDVDPVVVLVSLSFWYLIFGIIGALFSTVLTVVVIAIAAETPRIRWLAVVLSKKGDTVTPDAA